MLTENVRRVRRQKWDKPHITNLVEGVNTYGMGHWKKIHTHYGFSDDFTTVDLKDKWRNLVKYDHIYRSRQGGDWVLRRH